MISPEKLERYKDFVDPENTGTPYDPRQGLERLLGVLSPDPKGIVLSTMGEDWYGGEYQIQSRVFSWLEELGLPSSIWPLTRKANWSYVELKKDGQKIDSSLVKLGAVVKKIEQDPFRMLYQRSLAGAELAIPLVQQAVSFVVRAREDNLPHKFDSMWRVIGSVSSSTDQRKPLAVWDIIDLLVNHPGKHRQVDLQDETQMSQGRVSAVLSSLGNCGIIDYTSPLTEKGGRLGRGWSTYTLVNPQFAHDLNPDNIYHTSTYKGSSFHQRAYMTKIIDYIREHPNDEYNNALAQKLDIRSSNVSRILSLLVDLNILQRPDPSFKGSEVHSVVSANVLTNLFYEYVCALAKDISDSLSSLPLKPWLKEEVAVYLQNYSEERSHTGLEGAEEARRLLMEILSQNEGEMKLSHLTDLYNDKIETELTTGAIKTNLMKLFKLGLVEHPRLGYYRLVQK